MDFTRPKSRLFGGWTPPWETRAMQKRTLAMVQTAHRSRRARAATSGGTLIGTIVKRMAIDVGRLNIMLEPHLVR